MAHSFPSLLLATVAALAVAGQESRTRGQEPGVRSQGSEVGGNATPTSHYSPLTTDASGGQRLVADAARRIQNEPALSAELRYRINAFGHELVGSGSYMQLDVGGKKLLKLEVRMQVGELPASLQEIRGEDFYWMRRDVPPGAPTLERVNLRSLEQATGQNTAPLNAAVLTHDAWIMLGGLPQLLSSLDHHFAFETPRADDLHFSAADGQTIQRLPIWVVSGRWKPERLAALLNGDNSKAALTPEQLPERVELVLGRDDVVPLFPYRITYWQSPKADTRTKGQTPAGPRELLTLELFKVSRQRNIDPSEFLYNPGSQEYRDVTATYAQRLTGETRMR